MIGLPFTMEMGNKVVILCIIYVCICMIEAERYASRMTYRRHNPGYNRKNCITYPHGRRGSCERISLCPETRNEHFPSFRLRSNSNLCYWDYYYDEPVVCCLGQRSYPGSDVIFINRFPDTSSEVCGRRVTVSYGNAYGSSRLQEFYDRNPYSLDWGRASSHHRGLGMQQHDRPTTTAEPLPSAPSSIVGGREVTPRGWPWMAALFAKNDKGGIGRFLCGASLISNQHILTAAHCFVTTTQRSRDPSKYSVILGAHTIRGNDRDGEVYGVSEIKVHENYRQGQHYNDIAVVRLNRRAPPSMTPVCLPHAKDVNMNMVGKQATVTGWGDLAFGGVVSNVLREVTVPVISNRNCSASYERLKVARSTFPKGINNSLLCAGNPEGGKDACQGDSGGPLVVKHSKNVWQQIGIVSFGHGCASPGYSGVYTRVVYFRDWIKKHTGV